MRIHSVELGRVLLAPLSGVADSPFRRICRRLGADAVFSEMLSSEGLIRRDRKALALLGFHEDERPIGAQIFGRKADSMARAAEVVEEARPDLIDINLACPARKVVSRGAGCALMREPEVAASIAAAVVKAARLPVTAKIRIGWDLRHMNASELASMLQDAGVAAITVHGRTWQQGFREKSSWGEVAKVKKAVRIPVVLSGDVVTPEDARRAIDETGCDAVMVGRGAFGRPWVFDRIKRYLDDPGSDLSAVPGLKEVIDVALEHLDLAIAQYGETTAVVRFRKHLLWYTKGLHGVVGLRPVMSTLTRRTQVADLLSSFLSRAEALADPTGGHDG